MVFEDFSVQAMQVSAEPVIHSLIGLLFSLPHLQDISQDFMYAKCS